MATLGQQLKAAREAKGISAQEAGAATKILTKTIIAMEADDFSGMAAPTYAKGFIRLYARSLGLNPDPLIDEYLDQHVSGAKPPVEEQHQLEQELLKSSQGRRLFAALAGMPSKLKNLYTGQDIRATAARIAGVLVLIVLSVSSVNCVRRHIAEKSPQQPPAETAARRLLDKPLPDLYLVEPGKIESSR